MREVAPRVGRGGGFLWHLRSMSSTIRAVLSPCLLACVLVGGAGCERVVGFFSEPRAQVESPQRYEKDTISFAYPGNWNVKEEPLVENGIAVNNITVASAGNAILMIQTFKPAVPLDLAAHFEVVMAAMQEAVDKQVGGLADGTRGAVTDFERTFLGEQRAGKRGEITVTILSEKVPAVVTMLVAVLEDRTIMVFTTVPDDDRAKVEPGFDQVIDSLKAGS